MIKIQKKDFNFDKEINKIKIKNSSIGAVSIFIGYVRDFNDNLKVKYIDLEVYKDMAVKYLDKITTKAQKKWEILDILIIHRYGKLNVNDKIVLVATFAKHRRESYQACDFIMNYLKKDAPFWKKEFYNKSHKWLKNTKKKN